MSDKNPKTVKCVVLRDIWLTEDRTPAGAVIDCPADKAEALIDSGVLARVSK